MWIFSALMTSFLLFPRCLAWCCRPPKRKYTQYANMTKKPPPRSDDSPCLQAFNAHMDFDTIMSITYKGQHTIQRRHDYLVRMAYFMVLSACTQICSCMDGQVCFSLHRALVSTNEYRTAVSTMYLLAELLTVPNWCTMFKLKQVEQTALAACATLCRKTRDAQ